MKIEPQIPEVVLERLSLYHCLLQDWIINNPNKSITSREIANILGFTDETVRRDLSFLSKTTGKPGVGYDAFELYQLLSQKLKLKDRVPIVFVGSLSLLESLSEIFNFSKYGFYVEAVFSEKPEDSGKLYFGQKVKLISEIDSASISPECELAVVLVHPHWLQYALEKLKEAGIKGVLNFTPSVSTPFPEGITGVQLRYPCYLKMLQMKVKSTP